MVCPYCSVENCEGDIFCSECGRPLIKQEKKKKDIGNGKYRINGSMVHYLAKDRIEIVEDLKDVVIFPSAQQNIDGKYDLIFDNIQGSTLSEYIKNCRQISETTIQSIARSIIYILNRIQKCSFLLGGCDLDDFIFIDNNLEKLVLRAVRPLISLKEVYLPENYELGEFAAPEIRNGDKTGIKKSTDVYLAALLVNRMLIGDRYIVGDIDSQLFWAYIYTTSAFKNNYRKYHHWLGRCLSMFPGKRLHDMEACQKAFERSCNLDECSTIEPLRIFDELVTNVGNGKSSMMLSSGRDRSEWNEDVIEKWENVDKEFTAYLLADGISNCDIGSGYLASNIIRNNFIQVLKEYIDNRGEDITNKLVEQMAYQIVEKSNAAIWEESLNYSKSGGNIMGSTFIFFVIYKGRMYYYSLGDSLLYLVRNGNIIPLNSLDNVGILSLLKGISYAEYQKMEDKSNISLYIGGEFARNNFQYYKERSVETIVLKVGDIVLASSDGVLDYYGTKISDTKWEKEGGLTQKLINHRRPLRQRAHAIIKRGNENGGGDNLSVILIEIKGGMDNERF